MVRHPCNDNLNVKKGLWTADEDAKVLAYVSKHGTGNWTSVPKKAGLKRCGKSCRLRYTNYLRPDLKHDSFSPHEEELIVKLHSAIGSRWSIIAQQLPGRTDNDVKNYWNTKLRKKLSEMGIDPVTHKPFSQILADYGNISGNTNNTRIGSFLNRDLKNAFLIKSEPADQIMSHEVNLAKNCFFNSSSNSLGLLAQLQAIKLANDHQASINYIKSEPLIQDNNFNLSSPSSSSTCSSAAAQVMSPHAYNWHDFLLEDPSTTALAGSEMENGGIVPELNKDVKMKIVELDVGEYYEASSSDLFVEAMLERDNEMLLEFPSLLEEPFYD